jgi:G3E family GTPase
VTCISNAPTAKFPISVAARYSLAGIVTTVDAEHGDDQLDTHPESVKQAAVADRIVITKSDRVSADVLKALRARLAALNPGATVLQAVNGQLEPAKLFDTGLYQPGQKSPDVRRWLAAEAYRPLAAATAPLAGRTPASARHDARIRAFAVVFNAPVAWTELVDALETLAEMRGEQLLRIKGIVNVIGEDRPRAVHGVQHTLYPAAQLPSWPDADHSTRLVFITRDLDEAFVRETLAAFLGQQPDTRLPIPDRCAPKTAAIA